MEKVQGKWRIAGIALISVALCMMLFPAYAHAMTSKYGSWSSTTQGSTTYSARSSISYEGRVVDAVQTVKATQGNIPKGYVACNARLIKSSTGAVAASSGYKTNPSAKLVNQTFNASTVNYASGVKMAANTTFYSQGQTKALNNLTGKWYIWLTPKTTSYTTSAS